MVSHGSTSETPGPLPTAVHSSATFRYCSHFRYWFAFLTHSYFILISFLWSYTDVYYIGCTPTSHSGYQNTRNGGSQTPWTNQMDNTTPHTHIGPIQDAGSQYPQSPSERYLCRQQNIAQQMRQDAALSKSYMALKSDFLPSNRSRVANRRLRAAIGICSATFKLDNCQMHRKAIMDI